MSGDVVTEVVLAAACGLVLLLLAATLAALYTVMHKTKKDISLLQAEVGELRDQVKKGKGVTFKDTPNGLSSPMPVRALNGRRASSAYSVVSEYQDAVDDWLDSSPMSVATSNSISSAAIAALPKQINPYAEIDVCLNEHRDADKCYAELKKRLSSSPTMASDPELLWRLCQCCVEYSGKYQKKDPLRRDIIFEGREYGNTALALPNPSLNCIKWAAALIGAATDYVGTKEKIEQGHVFKELLDRAIAMDASDFMLLHLRARYSFSVANLSWIERKAAATFFATPPSATIEEALADFVAAHELAPEWVENSMYAARCYISKSDKPNAHKFLSLVASCSPKDANEKELHAEATGLLPKYK